MAELVSTLATAATAAASAAGSAASAAAPFAALASVGLGVTSAISQSNALAAQAKQQRLASQLEINKGQQDSLTIRRNLTRALASSAATYGARGLSLGSGTPETAADALTAEAQAAQTIASTNSTIRSESSGLAASNLAARADSTLTSGLIGGGLGLVNYVDGLSSRAAGTSTGNTEAAMLKRLQADSWASQPGGGAGGG